MLEAKDCLEELLRLGVVGLSPPFVEELIELAILVRRRIIAPGVEGVILPDIEEGVTLRVRP